MPDKMNAENPTPITHGDFRRCPACGITWIDEKLVRWHETACPDHWDGSKASDTQVTRFFKCRDCGVTWADTYRFEKREMNRPLPPVIMGASSDA